MHPDTEVRPISPAVGAGVVAARPLPAGTVVWALDPLDRVIPAAAAALLPPHFGPLLSRYCYRDPCGRYVLCWDHARLMNHSCDPNCVGTEWGFEVAVRDIAAGEQLTNDYAAFGLAPGEGFGCLCGAAGCRGEVSARDADRHARAALGRVGAALEAAARVPQPLGFLLAPGQLDRARAATGGGWRAAG